MKIAIDVMGGDYSPLEQVAGAVKWQEEHADQLFLVGRAAEINAALADFTYDPVRLTVVAAEEVIMPEEHPGPALRKKPDASIVVATTMVQRGEADALVSCGSTGAQLAAGIFILKRLPGVERPPLLANLPLGAGRVISLVDVGANVDCKPKQLLQFAVLGTVFARTMLHQENPSVGLLNNGAEETKGNAVAAETHAWLRAEPSLNFIGNVEGRDIFTAAADILVCDGFVGNLLLKSLEGFAMFVGKVCYEEFGKIPEGLKGFDYSQVGGLPLLGVNGVSVVCHGSSKRLAVYNAIAAAASCVERDLIGSQKQALAQLI